MSSTVEAVLNDVHAGAQASHLPLQGSEEGLGEPEPPGSQDFIERLGEDALHGIYNKMP